jgi:hypothetical protein
VHMLWGSRTAPWASLSPFVVDISYHVSVFVSGFYHGYKSHGWVLAAPTWSFIISTILLQHALALQLLPHFAFNLHACSPKVMARCRPLSEVAANMTGAEDVDKLVSAAKIVHTTGENPTASDTEGCLLSPDAAEDSLGKGGFDDENSRTYYFGSSTATVGKMKDMMENRYFIEGKACAPRAKTVLESYNDEAIVYEEFFVAGLRMPPHPALVDILLKFQAQLHQLMSSAIAQLSKYFWVVGSFRGIPEGNAFAKRYELHYQSKKVETPKGERFTYGCLNFHAKRDGGSKLSLAIKNKWSMGWMKSWFYCHVPCLCSSEGGKSVYALHS